jgi:hypothetical protein
VLAISGVGLAFGNGASSGLSEISAFVGVAVLFAFLMNAWIGSALPTLLPVVVALGFCVPFVEAKFQAPYAWWQVVTPPVRTSACADATGILSHLCMAPDEFAKIMRIDNAILANSAPEDTIYVYPHLPVFYLLSNRTPFDGAVVSWFDFTSDALAYDLSQRLKTSTPPVIVMAEIPEIVLAAHENLFRHNRPLGQRKILASVATLLATGRIERIEHITDLTGLTVDVYKRVDR